MLNTMNMADSYKKKCPYQSFNMDRFEFSCYIEVKDHRDPLFVLESNFLPKKIQEIFQTSTDSTEKNLYT